MLRVSIALVFVVVGVAHGDLMPASSVATGGGTECRRARGVNQKARTPSLIADGFETFDPTFGSGQYRSSWRADVEDPFRAQDCIYLTDRSGSLELCLYGLLATGLYGSGRWARKVFLACRPGLVPPWRALPGWP